MNQTIIDGNLTADCIINWSKDNKLAIYKFTLAHNESKKDSDGNWQTTAHFFHVVYFQKTSDFAQQLLKGTSVIVSGKLVQEKWEKDGQKHERVSIIANEIKLTAKREKQNTSEFKDVPTGTDENKDEDVPF